MKSLTSNFSILRKPCGAPVIVGAAIAPPAPVVCITPDVEVLDKSGVPAELNAPAQTWVRRWFTAYVKETLGRVRGKYSGDLKTPDSELKMDYDSLLTESKDEKSKLIEELLARLERLRPDKQMEIQANLAEQLNKSLQYRALPRQMYVI